MTMEEIPAREEKGGSGKMSAGHWGEQFQWREKVHQGFPELWDLKIVRKRLPFVLKYLKDGERVLEIGAFDRSLEGRLKQFRPRILYKSLDIDPTYRHDYTSLEQVDEKFDLVLLFELIEHLDWESGRESDFNHAQYLYARPVLEGCQPPHALPL